MTNTIINNPNWTDILQAIGAAIAIPLTLVTIFKLVKNDKERVSQIKSLSTMADNLTLIESNNEKRHISSKKPYIVIKFKSSFTKKRIKFELENTNKNTTIISWEITTNQKGSKDFVLSKSNINESNGIQIFAIHLSWATKPINDLILYLEYTTAEGYIFIQDINIWQENERFVYTISPVIDKTKQVI